MDLLKNFLRIILIDKSFVLRGCMIISLICLFFSVGASNSKRYYADGWDIVTVSEDTVVFYGSAFTWVADEVPEHMVQAVCHLTHEKENFYKIQNFEYPQDKVLKNISVKGWDSDIISPNRRVVVFKDLEDCYYTNLYMSYYLNNNSAPLYGCEKKIVNKDCFFSFELEKDYPDRSTPRFVSFSATPINYSWYSNHNRYLGPVTVRSGILEPITVPNRNYVEIRIPNLSD